MDERNRVNPPEKYRTFFVSLSLPEAAEIIRKQVEDESVTGELLDDYTVSTEGGVLRNLIFEKWFYRVGNRLVMTVTLDDLTGRTRIHVVSGGGGESVWWKFDWFAGESFADEPYNAMENYLIDE
ncbi:MAG: hypothetical protein II458_07110 [Oscillospiraceae bacterium]|jgi:hypothetical protein|nr:hypothetical protein [Oscillospiraceae bacterium]